MKRILKRKKVNSEINKDILHYWTPEKREMIMKRIRKAIFMELGLFEKVQEPKVQEWAHRMVPDNSLAMHANRMDLKMSIRKYTRKNTVIHLGLQKYFPELFEDDKKDDDDDDDNKDGDEQEAEKNNI